MCGILGFVGRHPPARRDMARALNLLAHRGPDGAACWHEPNVFFGHRRLAIIDLRTGAQPMSSADGRYVITFNGEIYNYPELREELRAAGLPFRTTSDTEVILAGYAAWGTGVVARLEGMFAFALHDRREGTTLLARDRFGEKPLLLAESGDGLAFASELAPLVALGLGGQEIDVDALGGYLCLNYVPGTRTLLRGIRRLPAGEWREYGSEGGHRRSHRYWTPPAPAAAPARPGDMLDELQERIDRATSLTVRSDVPVGLLLSGGVDSSIVAQSAARIGRLERAFCVDFAPAGASEWPRATAVASRLGIELERVPMGDAALSEFIDVAQHLDDPLADSSALAVWTVARAARRHVKVVLSGDGGDELFGGYPTYVASRWHRRVRQLLPAGVASWLAADPDPHRDQNSVRTGSDGSKPQRFRRALALDTREAHFTWNAPWLPREAALLAADAALRAATAGALTSLAANHQLPRFPSTLQLQLADAGEYMVNDILAKVDRAAMAHGLESRTPLLNRNVAELALSLPESLRVSAGGITKVALRRLCARHFGHAHAHAPKIGFSIPVDRWLRAGGRPLMTALLARDRVEALGLLDSGAVSRIVDSHLAGQAHGSRLWGLMVLVAWFESRVRQRPGLDQLPEADMVTLPS